jgi:hypothetical protein
MYTKEIHLEVYLLDIILNMHVPLNRIQIEACKRK